MSKERKVDLYEQPAYGGPEAARMLVLPLSTLRAWCFGQPHPSGESKRRFRALIRPADPKRRLLSFNNLCELHTLAAIRRHFGVRMAQVREAIRFVGISLGTLRPLLDSDFRTNGIHLFIQHDGTLLNASRHGQIEIGEEFLRDLARVSRNEDGKAVRLFPSTRLSPNGEPTTQAVVIDPRISFGRPVLAHGGVRTEIIQDRFLAGDSPEEMAGDFGVDEATILGALRFEQRLAA